MTLNQKIGVYISVSDVFPHMQSDFNTFKRLLHDLSRADTLFWCARLNLVVSISSEANHMVRQQFGLNQFLTSEEINAVNNFVRKNGGAQEVTVFFRGQILELIRWVTLLCHDHPDDGKTFKNPEVRRKFAQAALIASDIWKKRVFGNRFSMKGGVDIARERALGTIRKSIEGTSTALDLSKSLGRGWTLFKDYFPHYYPSFEDEFRILTKLSVEEYYICLSTIIANFMNPKIGTGIFDVKTLGDATPYRDVLKKYISLESQTVDELRNALWSTSKKDINSDEDALHYDYRPLRGKPIIRTNDGRAIILDPVCYSERASVGPVFLLAKNKSEGKANEIFGAFGNAFEKYACDILRRMFPDISGGSPKRLSCNIRGITRTRSTIEIDSCLNDIIEVVLFEMKAVWIREDKILTENYKTYLEHLREKYGVTKSTFRGRKNKGVGQLARIIKALASKEWVGQSKEFSKTQLIYPVLVVHDPFLVAPVHGNFLASEFKSLLTPDSELSSGELKKGRFRIAPLIVMTIDDLENLETSVEHFGFRELLAEYSQSCPDRLMSLRNFIASPMCNKKMYHNRKIAIKCSELLRKSKEVVFPNSGSKLGNGSCPSHPRVLD